MGYRDRWTLKGALGRYHAAPGLWRNQLNRRMLQGFRGHRRLLNPTGLYGVSVMGQL